MLPGPLQKALEHYAAILREKLGDRLKDVRLFGSWARGEAGEESDVDVWVLVDHLDDRARDVAFGATTAVLFEDEVAVSPTVMDEREWQHLLGRERRIARDILEEGQPL